MADRYWVGGTGTWDGTNTANWSTSSGGATGASVPTATDNVFFDANSNVGTGAFTVTMATTPRVCNDFTASGLDGAMTLSGPSIGLTVSGSLTFPATNFTRTYTGTTTFNATTTGKTVTTNGVTFNGSSVTFNGIGGAWTLGSALNCGVSTLTVTNGTFDTSSSGNYAITAGSFDSSNSNVRTINLNASTVTLGGAGSSLFLSTITNLTFNAGTSQINLSNTTAGISSGNLTFYNVAFTGTLTGTRSISGTNTFNNLSVTAPASAGVTTVTFAANQTINGTLSTTGTAGNCRVFFASSTYGIGYTLTVNSAPSLTDADFRDLYVIGTAAPISGTRIGNRGNCTGITFSTPKTVYWNLAVGGDIKSNAWATSSGGAVSTDNFPLPQDTATIVNTGLNTSATVSCDGAMAISAIDMSGRTNAMTFAVNANSTIYGSWTNGSGTTIAGSSTLTFSGGGTQTITSAGKTFSAGITVDTYGGTVQLADALDIGANTLTVTNGTFTTAGFAVTAGALASNNNNLRAISLGASTVTLSLSGSSLNFTGTTNFTFNAGTSQITFTGAPTIIGGGLTFYNVSVIYTGATGTTPYISGQNTFNNLTIVPRATDNIRLFYFFNNQTINGTLTCAGATATRRVFLFSDTIGTQRTLTVNSLSADDCDFRDIVIAGTAAGSSPTRAGDCGNNSGITFPSPKTVYWNLAGTQNWSATGWCTASGGTPAVNNFPLAQDTAVFDNTGSAGTVTINDAWNIGTFDASLRTSAMTFNTSTNIPAVYGNWTFGTGVTSLSNSGAITFAKNGTQTITSNGVQFGCPVTINNPNAYVQLADALSLNSARTIFLTTGTFDAVTYNVTTGLFTNSATTNTLKMGSGTWTLSGTGGVWAMNSVPILIAGTSTIVLSDTSTSGRTFAGGGLYYNKLTIGGATGTSTLSITGANTFGELASTKTVAHTILFTSTTTYNIGKWSVTGTAGNVVTVGPTTAATVYTLNIYGPANTGIDYLSVSYCAVSTTSPGELYVGANSTNTAGNTGAIIFTATPAARTLYWVGGTGNWSSTTKWATSSGGASGAAIPTSLDAVNFDSLSNATAYTATIDAGVTIARCASFTMAGPASGNVTFAGTVPIAYHGNVSFAATGITRTYTGSMNLSGNSSYTFTTNGQTLSSSLAVIGLNSAWTLGSALNVGTNGIGVTLGSLNTAGYAVSVYTISSSSTNVCSLSFGASTITQGTNAPVSFGTSTGAYPNFTLNAGTSSLVNSAISSTSFFGGNQTFYSVSLTSRVGTNIYQSNTFTNLTLTSPDTEGVAAHTFYANQTITGTLNCSATTTIRRPMLVSSTLGTPITLTVGTLSATDADFRDITITGAAAGTSVTRGGDCKGNSGITFPAAKTVYYRQTGSANWGATGSGSWSATSGGALDATQFPLAQDTAIFPAATYPASGSTTTINANYNIGTIDMSLRTSNTMTLATGSTSFAIYGSWINGTGTTLSSGSTNLTVAGRTTQNFTSAGKAFNVSLSVNSPGGSLVLQDSFVNNRASLAAFSLSAGTFDANNYNVTLTASSGVFATSGTATRTIAMGSGTWLFQATIGTPWSVSGSNITITGTATISLTGAANKTFSGGGFSYSGITLNQGSANTLSITGNNTFANITNTSGAATTINLAATTQTVGAFTAAGTAGNLLTITGTSAAAPATLVYTGGGGISGLDYLVPTFVRAYPTTSTWYAGNNSTNGGSLGWIFTAPPSGAAATGNFLIFFQ